MENKDNPSTSAVFPIALLIAAGCFFYYIYTDPYYLFHEYTLKEKIIAFVISCFLGGIIFGFASGIINAIYKAIIEIIVVVVLTGNVIYIAANYNKVRYLISNSQVETSDKIIEIILILLLLLLCNVIFVVILLPFARIAKSDLLDGEGFFE